MSIEKEYKFLLSSPTNSSDFFEEMNSFSGYWFEKWAEAMRH